MRPGIKRLLSVPVLLLGASIVLVALSACNLVTQAQYDAMQAATATQQANQRPTITIISPPNGAEYTVGSTVLISVNATDQVGITRVTLSISGQVVDSVQSESPNGSTNLNALLDFTPQQVGVVQLTATAFRNNVSSDPAIIEINVRQSQAQVTATLPPQPIPSINPNDPTCRALVNVGLNVRTGPSTNFPLITTLAAGSVVPIVGRTAANDWWQVRVNAVSIGWVASAFTTVFGNCTLIPVVPSPPTPTSSAPTATDTPIPPTNTLTLTPVPPTLTATPGLPDLVVTSIVGPNAINLGPGSTPTTTTFSITITNTGQSAASQFTTTLQIQGVGAAQPIGVVANLLPNESIVLNGNLTFDTVGTFTVVAVADAFNQVAEITKVNNSGSVNIVVNPPL
ncbi:MAG: SH3 domain-containing protein [Anaerolineae bacterium]|nr:SH3 domain-containing protein [Anaerolineae bacterium]